MADGAGSASEGALGAELAVTSVLRRAQDTFSPLATEESAIAVLRNWVYAARIRLEEEAQKRGIGLSDVATTLLITFVTTRFAAVAQIGDGAIISRDRCGDIQLLTNMVVGEYVNETTFLTSTDTELQVCAWSGEVQQIMLFTDGLQRVALQWPGPDAHAPFCAPLFDFIARSSPDLTHEEQVRKFLTSARIRQRCDDDLTLVLAHRAESQTQQYRRDKDLPELGCVERSTPCRQS